jgi:hypothetical protein
VKLKKEEGGRQRRIAGGKEKSQVVGEKRKTEGGRTRNGIRNQDD